MVALKKEESKKIYGGALNITGALANAFKGVVMVFFEVGQAFGGAMRRITSNKLCEF